MRIQSVQKRSGFSLIEVMVSLTIFLLALVAIGSLTSASSDQAKEVRDQNTAARLAQSKVAEVVAGIIPVNGGGSGTFDDEPDWQWSVETETDSSIANLWIAKVRVWREFSNGVTTEANLAQYVIDPVQRGTVVSTQQQTTTTGTTTDSSSSGSSSSQSSSSSTPSSSSSSTPSSSSNSGISGGSFSGSSNRPSSSSGTKGGN